METIPEPSETDKIAQRIGLSEGQASQHNSRSRLGTLALAGLATIAGLGLTAWKFLDNSGKYEHFKPTIERPVQIDGSEHIISWNIAGQAARRQKQIRTLAKRYNADVVMLQEVDTDDAARLHHDFPSWHIIYALADQKQHVTQGGYGNVIMTRQEPTDIKTRSFSGTSFVDSTVGTITGFTADVANLDTALTATKNGWQERRVAVAETTKVLSQDKLTDIRTVDVHISGNSSVHTRQLSEAMDFIKSNLNPAEPLVTCGDFNTKPPAEVTAAFARIGMITPVKQGINSDYNGDYCAYYIADEPTLARVRVLNDFKTDHYPLE